MGFLQFESFGPRVSETFRLVLGAGGVDMTLLLAQKLPNRPYPGQIREPFRLHLKSPHRTILPQAIYRFENDAMGKLDIFIVPVARDRDGIIYEAIFN
jgi:hypothetical protein